MNDSDFNSNRPDKEPWEAREAENTPVENEAPQPPADQAEPEATEQAPENTAAPEDHAAAQEPKTEQPRQNPYGQPYQNPYNPYGNQQNPYGQYQNPYGGYHYGQNGYNQNGYGQYPYGQNYGQGYQQNPQNQQNQQNRQNPQDQAYWSYPQYGQYQPNRQPPMPPKKKSTGLRVFLWVLCVLLGGSVLGFSVYGVYEAVHSPGGVRLPSASSSQQRGGKGSSSASSGTASQGNDVIGGVAGNGTNPNSTGITINSEPTGSALSAKDVFKKVVNSVVGVKTEITDASTGEKGTGEGTGIVASSDGYILTNAHVVNYSRANKVTVVLHNQKQYAAVVVGYDKTSDIAVLKINATGLSPAEFGNADQLEVGDSVVAIGNPGGLNYASTLTGGLISALNRTIESHSDNGMTYIQTDAAINPGNSGGPLLNMYGQVVGINSNKIVAEGYEGMGFAIPVSKAKPIIDDLVVKGYVSGRSRLGITAQTLSNLEAQVYGVSGGVVIKAIGSDSDMTKQGVKVGDVITKADGQEITSLDDLYAMLAKHKAGDSIALTVYSKGAGKAGSSREVKVLLLEDKGETQTQLK